MAQEYIKQGNAYRVDATTTRSHGSLPNANHSNATLASSAKLLMNTIYLRILISLNVVAVFHRLKFPFLWDLHSRRFGSNIPCNSQCQIRSSPYV